MAELKFGSVTVVIDDALTPPAVAGKLNAAEMAAIPKARRGVGMVCEACADGIAKAGARVALPPAFTPDGLRLAGQRAERIDQVLSDLEVIKTSLQQANLIFDGEAHSLLCRLNDQVKAQARDDAGLWDVFAALKAYFGRGQSQGAKNG